MLNNLTKGQKAIIFISILWELILLAFCCTANSADRIFLFLIFSIPCILYWGGVWILGFGYVLNLLKKIFICTKNNLVPFLFSYKGRFNRLQYFGGLIVINAISFLFYHLNDYIAIIWEGFYLYMLLGFVQKRSRDLNENSIKFVVPLFLANFAYSVKDIVPESYNVTMIILSFMLLYGAAANLYLLFYKGTVTNEDKKVYEINTPIRMTIILYIIYLVVSYIFGYVIGYMGQKEIKFSENDKTTYSYLKEYTSEQQKKLGASVGFIYRHTKGYKEVCQKEGYIMAKYPNDFLQYFSTEINQLKNNLSKHNYTIENVEDMLVESGGFKTTIITSIYTELENLGKLTIISLAAEEQGIPIEDVKWNSEWDNLLTFKDICKAFDENGIEILKEGENKYLLKANSF